jgi:lysophospholipase L1-like esterase
MSGPAGAERPGTGAAQRAMTSRRRRLSVDGWMGRLGLVVGSFAVTLGLIEAVLRLVPAWSRATARDERFAFNPYRPDGRLGFTLRPGVRVRHTDRDFSVTVAVNALGARGPERGSPKPPDTRRILLLGDSFAFGWGVEQEETFGARLERLLSERVGPVEVLSAAVPGWSTDQQYLYLRVHGLALDPDLILLAEGENDLEEIGLNRLTLDEDGLPVRIEPMWRIIDATGRMRYLGSRRTALPRQAWPGETWLKDHSLLYHWLRFRLVKASSALAVRRARPPAPEWLIREPALPINRVPPDELQRALASSADFRLRYHLFLLEAMEREARARGVPMRTLLVAHSGETRPADPALAGLHTACAARGEACLDSARVISAAERERFTFAHDSHWNPEGHRRIGEALAAWLEAEPGLRRGLAEREADKADGTANAARPPVRDRPERRSRGSARRPRRSGGARPSPRSALGGSRPPRPGAGTPRRCPA